MKNNDNSNVKHEPPGEPGGASEDELKWSEQFGRTDAARPASHEKCGGCGAQMHCKVLDNNNDNNNVL